MRVPRALTRAEEFDDVAGRVLDEVALRADEETAARLAELELRVDDVPPDVHAPLPDHVQLLEEDGVPLAAVVEAQSPRRGRATPAVVVLYRRPLEARAGGHAERTEVLLDVVVEAVSRLLGVDPDELHPDGPAED